MFTHICQAIIVLLLGLTSSAFAATYHVNQATGSNGNACSTDPAQARQSINAGIVCLSWGYPGGPCRDLYRMHQRLRQLAAAPGGHEPGQSHHDYLRSAPGETLQQPFP